MTRVILLWAGAIALAIAFFWWLLLAFPLWLFWHPWVMLGVLIVGPLLVGGAAYYTLGAQRFSPLRVAARARVMGFVGGAMCIAPLIFPPLMFFLLGGPIVLALAITTSAMAIGGARLALKKRKAAGILMLASGIVAWAPTCILFLPWDLARDLIWDLGLYIPNEGAPIFALFVGLYYILPSFFLIPGGILALIARAK